PSSATSPRALHAVLPIFGRPVVPLLELHVTHACNLACESCSHYSDHGHRGNLDLAEADRWMAAWSGRLHIEQFNLLGGEPTIHRSEEHTSELQSPDHLVC